jgi:hypothetical protein
VRHRPAARRHNQLAVLAARHRARQAGSKISSPTPGLAKISDEDAELLYDDAELVARRILKQGARSVLLTRGAQGATWLSQSGDRAEGAGPARPGP